MIPDTRTPSRERTTSSRPRSWRATVSTLARVWNLRGRVPSLTDIGRSGTIFLSRARRPRAPGLCQQRPRPSIPPASRGGGILLPTALLPPSSRFKLGRGSRGQITLADGDRLGARCPRFPRMLMANRRVFAWLADGIAHATNAREHFREKGCKRSTCGAVSRSRINVTVSGEGVRMKDGLAPSGSRWPSGPRGSKRLTRLIRFLVVVPLILTPIVSWAQAPELGVVTTLQGQASVARVSGAGALPLKFKDAVFDRDRIQTGEESIVKVLMGGKAIVTIRELSVLTITEELGKTTINLTSGKIAVGVAKQRMKPGDRLEVHTPNAVGAVPSSLWR